MSGWKRSDAPLTRLPHGSTRLTRNAGKRPRRSRRRWFLKWRWFSNSLWQSQVAAPKTGATTGGALRPRLTGYPKIPSFRQSSPNLRPIYADRKKFAEQNSSALELSTISARKSHYHRNCAALNTTAEQNNSGLGLSTIAAPKIRHHRSCAGLNTTAEQNNSGLGLSTISAPKIRHHRSCAGLNTTAEQNNSGLGLSTILGRKRPHRAAPGSRARKTGRMTANFGSSAPRRSDDRSALETGSSVNRHCRNNSKMAGGTIPRLRFARVRAHRMGRRLATDCCRRSVAIPPRPAIELHWYRHSYQRSEERRVGQ